MSTSPPPRSCPARVHSTLWTDGPRVVAPKELTLGGKLTSWKLRTSTAGSDVQCSWHFDMLGWLWWIKMVWTKIRCFRLSKVEVQYSETCGLNIGSALFMSTDPIFPGHCLWQMGRWLFWPRHRTRKLMVFAMWVVFKIPKNPLSPGLVRESLLDLWSSPKNVG